GLAGIGGGVIMVPAMVFLMSFDQHIAQGTSLLAIVFTSIAGTVVNRRNEHVQVKNALLIGGIGAIVAFGAARFANTIDAELLGRMFGVLILFSGARMLYQPLKN
ncbi:MAG: sulfite exporter TauE/SafE family protein, partial [Acidimicrobiia bacterium]